MSIYDIRAMVYIKILFVLTNIIILLNVYFVSYF